MAFSDYFITKVELITKNNLNIFQEKNGMLINQLAEQCIKEQALCFEDYDILKNIYNNKMQYLNNIEQNIKNNNIHVAIFKKHNTCLGLCVFKYMNKSDNNVSFYNTILSNFKNKINPINIICLTLNKRHVNKYGSEANNFFKLLIEKFIKMNITHIIWEPREPDINEKYEYKPDYGSLLSPYGCKNLKDWLINIYIEKQNNSKTLTHPFVIIKKSELKYKFKKLFEFIVSHLNYTIGLRISKDDIINFLTKNYNLIHHKEFFKNDIIFAIPKQKSSEFKILCFYDIYKIKDINYIDPYDFILLINDLLETGPFIKNKKYIIFELIRGQVAMYQGLHHCPYNPLEYSSTYLYKT